MLLYILYVIELGVMLTFYPIPVDVRHFCTSLARVSNYACALDESFPRERYLYYTHVVQQVSQESASNFTGPVTEPDLLQDDSAGGM